MLENKTTKFIPGPRPLRIITEEPRTVPMPTNNQELHQLKARGYAIEEIFDQTRIKPKTDYTYGGGPITAYEYSGTVFERVSGIVPLEKLAPAQRAFITQQGYTEVAELKRFDKRWRRTRHTLWVPVHSRAVVCDWL